MRCFIAIRVPQPVATKIGEVQKRLEGDMKRVEPENLHVNLAFLGDVEDSKVPGVGQAMDMACAGFKRFRVRVRGVGGFPDSHHPRVVWAGVEGDFSIQKRLESGLVLKGFPTDSRQFKPHITLARVRSGMVRLPDVGELGEFWVESVELMRSELTGAGPIYSSVHTAHLE